MMYLMSRHLSKSRLVLQYGHTIWRMSSTTYALSLNNAVSMLRNYTEPNCTANYSASALTSSLHEQKTFCQWKTLIRSRYKTRFAESKHNNKTAVQYLPALCARSTMHTHNNSTHFHATTHSTPDACAVARRR